MDKMGNRITRSELASIMREHDIEKNNLISYTEFKALMLDITDIKEAEQY